jgi:hypothetical protein
MRVVRAGSRRRRIHAASAHSTAPYVDRIVPSPGYRRDPRQGRFPQTNPTQVISGNCFELHGHHQDLISQTGQFGRRQAGFETRQAGFETGRACFETNSIAFASHLAAAIEQFVPLNDSAPLPPPVRLPRIPAARSTVIIYAARRKIRHFKMDRTRGCEFHARRMQGCECRLSSAV